MLCEQDVWDRFIMVVKPEQSGKTFVMINKINEFLRDDQESDRITVNFIFCDNNLLLTKQTKERIAKEVYLPDTEEPYVELSSRRKAKRNSAEVRDAIEDGCKNIVCCTNGKRIVDILSIIQRMNTHNISSYNFKIWFDEADKFYNYIKNKLIPLCQDHDNVEVRMLTATPQPIFEKFKEVRTMALENTTLPTYHGWNDCEIIIREENSRSTLGYAQQIAAEMLVNGELTPGKKGYVPADRYKISHTHMRDIFISKGCAVFIVNGDGIELTLPDNSTRPDLVKKTEELHVHIRELYKKYNVSKWPCIVTGNICVGRGISLQQPDFMFDFGILSNCTKKTEASQNAGRLKGNFKNWPRYTPPRVYTTSNFDKVASEYEEQSREIAKLAFTNNNDSEGSSIITHIEVKNIVYSKRWELIENEFDTLEEANALLSFYGCRKKSQKILDKNKDENGFIKSSTTNKLSVLDYNKVKEEMKSWKPTATLDTNKRNKHGAYGRMYIAYRNIEDITSIKYLVRIALDKTHN